MDTKTGYFNATKLCKVGNKKFNDWSRSERSKRLIEYFQQTRYGISRIGYEVKGSNDDVSKQITGTYVPKELILDSIVDLHRVL